MKSAADILKELGFKQGSSPDTQQAFYNYLVKDSASHTTPRENNLPIKNTKKLKKQAEPEQLSFPVELLGPRTKGSKKAS